MLVALLWKCRVWYVVNFALATVAIQNIIDYIKQTAWIKWLFLPYLSFLYNLNSTGI